MSKRYSIYDAKAHLSALVRQVRESGRTFVMTVHGEPVAELRPIETPRPAQALKERLAELEASGQITPSNGTPGEKPNFRIGKPSPGALQRFLDERD